MFRFGIKKKKKDEPLDMHTKRSGLVGFGSTALPKPVSPTESLQQRYATSATENPSLMHAAHHDDISLGLPSLHFFRQRSGWVLFTTDHPLGKGSSMEVNAPVFPSLLRANL